MANNKIGHKVTIVVPVYGDWASLNDCIDSLKLNIDVKLHRVMLVNDCGPDVDVIENNIKNSIKGFNNFKYYRNDKNLGFVGTCNRAATEIDKTNNDILLLNSDTIVTKGFVEEMCGVLYDSKFNGAVSPRSNNATIATIPLSAAVKKDITPEQSYDIYNKIKSKLPRSVVVPVAHGFCILIRHELIKKYGLFDTAFGRGYGEEVDFCLRIKENGYHCLLANHAFVFHLEARSFSMETKRKLIEENNKIIWSRYPSYRQDVRDYMNMELLFENSILNNNNKSYNVLGGVKAAIKSNKFLYKIINKILK